MLPVMLQNSWMPTLFEDFLNTDWMPRANSTASAVNVKESEKAYTMELAAPGIKKEYCRVSINDECNLTIAIENKAKQLMQGVEFHSHPIRLLGLGVSNSGSHPLSGGLASRQGEKWIEQELPFAPWPDE